MDSEMKIKDFFFQSFEGHFPFHLERNKGRQLVVYKNTIRREQKPTLPACCVTRLLRRYAEVQVRMPQPHDAAEPPQRPGAETQQREL